MTRGLGMKDFFVIIPIFIIMIFIGASFFNVGTPLFILFPPLCWKRPRARNSGPILRFCFRTEFLKIRGCGFSKTQQKTAASISFFGHVDVNGPAPIFVGASFVDVGAFLFILICLPLC